ncbi:MAG TPA: type II toxin-antitoxin system PemK/MazF family toxin [Candidatus Kapabacteria bacterium]|nr:type II toxin-antitoxin system PemK/MazF family toxin [Candidatus Kapabacteria bacterium]
MSIPSTFKIVEFRWNVFLANLDPVIGSEQGKTRPVLIVSDEGVNQLLSIVNGLPITSRKGHRKIYPNEVLLNAGMAGLTLESIVLCQGAWRRCRWCWLGKLLVTKSKRFMNKKFIITEDRSKRALFMKHKCCVRNIGL